MEYLVSSLAPHKHTLSRRGLQRVDGWGHSPPLSPKGARDIQISFLPYAPSLVPRHYLVTVIGGVLMTP